MRLWAHYEVGSDGEDFLLELSSDRIHFDIKPGDWVEEQQWIRFDQEKP